MLVYVSGISIWLSLSELLQQMILLSLPCSLVTILFPSLLSPSQSFFSIGPSIVDGGAIELCQFWSYNVFKLSEMFFLISDIIVYTFLNDAVLVVLVLMISKFTIIVLMSVGIKVPSSSLEVSVNLWVVKLLLDYVMTFLILVNWWVRSVISISYRAVSIPVSILDVLQLPITVSLFSLSISSSVSFNCVDRSQSSLTNHSVGFIACAASSSHFYLF